MPLIEENAALRELCAALPDPLPAAGRQAPPATCPPVISSALRPVLVNRRSIRRFAERPVPAGLLAAACLIGINAERAWWPPELHGDAALGVAIAAMRVHDLAPGIHAFSATTGGFRCVGGQTLLGELQKTYVPAPALVLVYGELGRIPGTPPGPSYQAMLVRAAALGHTALLNAMTAGLGGCPFGRAANQVSRLLSASHARRIHQLSAIAVGWPPATEAHRPEAPADRRPT